MAGLPVSALILAGGASSRMGRNKALTPVGGIALIERALAALRPLTDDIQIIANDPEPYAYLALPCIPDQQAGFGPLMGLYSGLHSVRNELALLIACDMPFVNTDVLRYLIAQAEDHDVVIPRTAEGVHPLHALYRCSTCAPAIAQALAAGERRMTAFHPLVRVREVSEDELRLLDPEGIGLMNVNTPDEWATAEHIARRAFYHEEED